MGSASRPPTFRGAVIPLVLMLAVASASGPCLADGEILSPKIARLYQMLEQARPGEADAVISAMIEENRDRFPLVEDSLALVSARVYFGPLGMGAQTYLAEQVDGVWQVVGTTGVRIVS